ncbi:MULTISPECIES: EamA family transporter [Pyrobaculum]|uniref:Transcriptional regulator, Fis family n=1 Tax=Pyrobaculum arsenaticum (strain DSM 13514 / JCM 11321 / PZ6) TaxID=340102 RepID=A4WJD0_PYRAR|nr:EamA family transporter [Pyrobaculum arsenaticum]ABP50497.1 transcriptional regulator, Fis family [Pyrobaculum arsenaticum DSM 13514]
MLALLGVAAHFQTLMSVEKLAALAYISLVPGALAYTIWNLAMAKAGHQAASAFPFMPVFTLIISTILLHEVATEAQLLGMTLAIIGVSLTIKQ